MPVWVVGGYLGAGKTTLLNALLRTASGVRYAVLVNDFGSVNVDAELIAAAATETIELTNGCSCCTTGGDLVFALRDLLTRGTQPERIVIEASGVADPRAVARLAACHPSLAVRGTIVVADAETIVARAGDKYVGRLVRRQLGAADAVVLTRADLLDAPATRAVRDWMTLAAPGVPLFASGKDDAFPAEIVFDPGFVGRDRAELSPEPGHPAFVSRTYRNEAPLERKRFDDAVRALVPVVARAKGTVYFSDAPGTRYVFQLAGQRSSVEPLEVRENKPESRIVAIALAEREHDLEVAFEKLEAEG